MVTGGPASLAKISAKNAVIDLPVPLETPIRMTGFGACVSEAADGSFGRPRKPVRVCWLEISSFAWTLGPGFERHDQ